MWHYPRKSFADFILDGMTNQLLDRVTIFAPRKRGKTEFIRKDVIPACHEREILPVYIDFWKIKDDPAAAFIHGVEEAIESNQGWFKGLLSKFKMGGKLELKPTSASASVTVEASESKVGSESLLNAFRLLEKCDKPVLLLLDEVQHLATKESFSDFTSSLRSFMVNGDDKHIKGIFTGSSQSGLTRLFNDSKAPFYNSSQTLAFKELDIDFVTFELQNFSKASGGATLDANEALEVFKKQGRAPGRFVDLLKTMVLNAVHDLEEGVKKFDRELAIAANESYIELVSELKPLDLTLLRLIAMGENSKFYTEQGKAKIVALASTENIPTSRTSISNSITRLSNDGIIFSIKHGTWQLEDPALRDFLIEHNF
ncbi:hypothetical protein [Vibrio owensii]|uniref:hypothetical protein n=1 Tax=Vibrio harveyi group TaxID=717610 RepID=UPI003CC6BF37